MTHRWACLLGEPVAHSLSPALHNAAFAALDIDAHYEARLVAYDELPDVVQQLRAGDCLGANVTAPHKQAVVALVDQVGDEVRALGVLNTIVNVDGRLLAGNTDAEGLARWMRLSQIDPAGHPAVVIGAGGAARSTVWALADLGATAVVVLNRTVERAQALITSLRPHLTSVDLMWGGLAEAAEPAARPWRVVVNATSMGHHGAAPAVHPSWYSRDSVAIELAYNPPVTGFMVAAREAGARAENGLGMLLHQAALAFEHWTGQAPPMDVYEAVVRQRIGT
ncbi:MAG: shikimate dehydrogenase [Chloroflexi bacterium]|nr:shikimate dehydrogenase [Actinomycetota bacterium]MBV9323643.1 shikimate dehydrogenase [Chloroflexota bacterium]MBV9601062.1 shikimate dehydrogenase [Chloroflexota bacterium]